MGTWGDRFQQPRVGGGGEEDEEEGQGTLRWLEHPKVAGAPQSGWGPPRWLGCPEVAGVS